MEVIERCSNSRSRTLKHTLRNIRRNHRFPCLNSSGQNCSSTPATSMTITLSATVMVDTSKSDSTKQFHVTSLNDLSRVVAKYILSPQGLAASCTSARQRSPATRLMQRRSPSSIHQIICFSKDPNCVGGTVFLPRLSITNTENILGMASRIYCYIYLLPCPLTAARSPCASRPCSRKIHKQKGSRPRNLDPPSCHFFSGSVHRVLDSFCA